MQACGACGTRADAAAADVPALPLDSTYEWEPLSGRGTIWSFVVPHPPLLPAYAELAPYNVIVVALDEDPTIRFVGNLLASPDGAINEIDPATIEIGEPVRVVFQQIEDVTLPRWVLALASEWPRSGYRRPAAEVEPMVMSSALCDETRPGGVDRVASDRNGGRATHAALRTLVGAGAEVRERALPAELACDPRQRPLSLDARRHGLLLSGPCPLVLSCTRSGVLTLRVIYS